MALRPWRGPELSGVTKFTIDFVGSTAGTHPCQAPSGAGLALSARTPSPTVLGVGRPCLGPVLFALRWPPEAPSLPLLGFRGWAPSLCGPRVNPISRVKMLKAESSGERTTLRSASPHRNAYRTEFQALKSTFDKPKSDGEQKTKDGEGSQQSRGRKYGSNVNRIKNLFMQMGMEPNENAAVVAKTRGKGRPSSPQRRMKPKEFVEKTDGSVVRLESSVSERISRFDTMHDGPSYAKFTETRKMFERSVHESGHNNRYSPKKEKAGGAEPQDEWGGSKSNRGSSDSLDSLSPRTEAVSPTVSQLSAVFESTESLGAITSEKAENSDYSVTGHYPLNLPSVTVTNLDTFGHLKDSNSRSSPNKHGVETEDAQGSATPEVAWKGTSLASLPSEEIQPSKEAEDVTSAQETLGSIGKDIAEEPSAENQAMPKSGILSPQNQALGDAEASVVGSGTAQPQKRDLTGGDVASPDASASSCGKEVPEDSNNSESSHVYMHSDYNVYRVRSRYNSDWGETGTEQDEEEDSDDNNYYQPDMEYSEIVGLPEEEEIPANRKIKFSCAPIKAKFSQQKCFISLAYELCGCDIVSNV
ncbi:protein phosphatase 1 regulatory subunit 9A [Cricetulus griseus]